MNEDVLQFAWKTRNFSPQKLATTQGEPVTVLSPGVLNTDQGPDFLHARVRIGETEHHGSAEIHVDGGDWFRHGHHRDVRYENVVLHVVWKSGRPARRPDGSVVPEVVLEGRVPPELQQRWQQLQLSQSQIPCAGSLPQVPELITAGWLGRMGFERMEEKANRYRKVLAECRGDFEQALWQELARCAGGPVNGEAFAEMARRIPAACIRKYSRNRMAIEALLYGAAGITAGTVSLNEKYWDDLRREWIFLSGKHKLEPVFVPLRFLRMRPASFPTIRLSQLAALLCVFPSLTVLLEPGAMDDFLRKEYTAGAYWETHYRAGESSAFCPRPAGDEWKVSILINVLAPFGMIYAQAHGRAGTPDAIRHRLESLPPEANKITRAYSAAGITARTAWESQALIHLHRQWCAPKKCLLCAVGNSILSSHTQPDGNPEHHHHRHRT